MTTVRMFAAALLLPALGVAAAAALGAVIGSIVHRSQQRRHGVSIRASAASR